MLNRALPVAAGALHVGPGSLAGWSIKETSGGAAGEIRIYDNAAAATGTIVAIIAVAASGGQTIAGVDVCVDNGLFVQVVSGTFAGSIHVG